MERERERDVDNKMRNLLTYSKQLNLRGCRTSLVRDNEELIITVRRSFINMIKPLKVDLCLKWFSSIKP